MSFRTTSTQNLRAPAFIAREDDRGVLWVRVSDPLRDMLAAEFGVPGYIARDENAHIARLASRFGTLIGASGREFLSLLATGNVGNGVAVFTNLPWEQVDWSPVPGAPAHSAKETSLSEHLLLTLSDFFGNAYGVYNEGDRVVNDLVPSRSDLDKHTGNGSRKELGLHAENIALRFAMPGRDFSPKALLLTGVSAQKIGGPTTPVAIAARAVDRLTEEEKIILRAPCTKIKLPVRQRSSGGMEHVGPVPVILGAEGQEEVAAAFYDDMMIACSPEAEAALAALRTAMNDVAVHLQVLPGTLVYIANGRALHGRSDFEPVFDEHERAQRWLQRVFVTGRLDTFAEHRRISDRVFDVKVRAQAI